MSPAPRRIIPWLFVIAATFVTIAVLGEGFAPRTRPPELSLFPSEIVPGEASVLLIDHGLPGRYRILDADGDTRDGGTLLQNPEGEFVAFVAVPLDWPLGTYTIETFWEAGGGDVITLQVQDGNYPSAVVTMSERTERLVAEPDPRKTEQSKRLLDILKTTDDSAWYLGRPFELPLGDIDRISSGFGQTRRYRYPSGRETLGFHLGIDYPKPDGTPVYAPGTGKVFMAEERILTGFTVILEHFPGVYSLYFHLSSLNVALDDFVAPGDLIARVGSTGLSTGPHLHWELRIMSHAVNPSILRSPDFVAAMYGR